MKIRNIYLLKLGFLKNLEAEAKFTLSYKKKISVNQYHLKLNISGAATAIIGTLPASRGQLLPGYLMLLLHPSLTPPQARICQHHLLPYSPGEPAWWRSRVKMLVLTL